MSGEIDEIVTYVGRSTRPGWHQINKQTKEDLATHPQHDERLRLAKALKNIVLSNKSVKNLFIHHIFPHAT